MSNWKKRQRRHHLRQIEEALEERHLSPALPDEATPDNAPDIAAKTSRPDPKARERARLLLVERKIQEAMAEGAFDNLPGAGKPFDLAKNPYLDSSQELAFGLLKNNNMAPEWIERDKEIRRHLEAARHQLRLAWEFVQDDPAQEQRWQDAVARFAEKLAKLNRKIDDFNLIVPVISCHRPRLVLEHELRRVQHS